MTAALRTLRMLTRYTAWADARLYAAVAGLPQHELAARRATGVGSRPPVMDLPVFLRDVPQAPAADPAA